MRRIRSVHHSSLQSLATTSGLWKVDESHNIFSRKNTLELNMQRLQSPHAFAQTRSSVPTSSKNSFIFASPKRLRISSQYDGKGDTKTSQKVARNFSRGKPETAEYTPIIKSVCRVFMNEVRKTLLSICWKLRI